jgi:hypothetical protein
VILGTCWHGEARKDRERTLEPHEAGIDLQGEVVLAVELNTEDREVEETLEQLIAEMGDDLEIRVVLGTPDGAMVLRSRSVVDLPAVTPVDLPLIDLGLREVSVDCQVRADARFGL